MERERERTRARERESERVLSGAAGEEGRTAGSHNADRPTDLTSTALGSQPRPAGAGQGSIRTGRCSPTGRCPSFRNGSSKEPLKERREP